MRGPRSVSVLPWHYDGDEDGSRAGCALVWCVNKRLKGHMWTVSAYLRLFFHSGLPRWMHCRYCYRLIRIAPYVAQRLWGRIMSCSSRETAKHQNCASLTQVGATRLQRLKSKGNCLAQARSVRSLPPPRSSINMTGHEEFIPRGHLRTARDRWSQLIVPVLRKLRPTFFVSFSTDLLHRG
jgi:hypothetical protein